MYNLENIYDSYSENEKSHSFQVVKLALLIFDKISFLHKLGEKERGYLCLAAKFHDVGRTIGSAQHYLNSYKIISNSKIKGFNSDEIEIIAQVARYHSGQISTKNDEHFKKLNDGQKKLVHKLAGILRVADLLDREHLELVKNLDFEFEEDEKILTMWLSVLQKGYFPDVKILAKKKILFEKTFEVQLVLKLAR